MFHTVRQGVSLPFLNEQHLSERSAVGVCSIPFGHLSAPTHHIESVCDFCMCPRRPSHAMLHDHACRMHVITCNISCTMACDRIMVDPTRSDPCQQRTACTCAARARRSPAHVRKALTGQIRCAAHCARSGAVRAHAAAQIG